MSETFKDVVLCVWFPLINQTSSEGGILFLFDARTLLIASCFWFAFGFSFSLLDCLFFWFFFGLSLFFVVATCHQGEEDTHRKPMEAC